LAATQKFAGDFAPQFLLWHDDDQPGSPRLGVNLTRLVGGACVAHLEASAGRVPSRLAVAQGRANADLDWRGQGAVGGPCTSARTTPTMIELWWAHDHAIASHALAADEHARAERFLCSRTAQTYRAAHTLKRRVLSHHRPEVSPAGWRFATNAWGKPVVDGPVA